MTPLQNLTVEQLRNLIAIKEQIETLESELEAIAGGGRTAAPPVQPAGPKKRSAAVRARMAAAQQARWAKKEGGEKEIGEGEAAPKKKAKFSAAHRAALAAAQKARWAKVRAGKTEAKESRRRNDGE